MTTPNVSLNSYDNNYQPIQFKTQDAGTIGSVFTEVQEGDNSNEVVKKYTKEDIKKMLKDSLLAVVKENNINIDALNLNLDDDKNIEKILYAFTDIKNINDFLTKDNSEIDNIIEKIIKDAKVALNTGWTLKGFCNQQKNCGKDGLSKRLAGFSPQIAKNGFANVSAEEQKSAIKAFFNDFFATMDKKESHEVVVRKQLQTFGRILINSSEEEKVAFKEVVKQLLAENIEPGIKEVLESLDNDKDRRVFAESFTNEDLKEISQTEDQFGNRISNEDMQSLMDMLTQYKSKKSIISTHEFFDKEISDFIEANKEALDTIQKKIENNEPLTDEEQELLNEFNMKKAIAAGEMTGTAENKGLSEDEIDEILRGMNEDNFNHGEDFYCGVMENIEEYINSHPELQNLPELIDRISNGNYTIITTGEAKNGLNPPVPSGESGGYQSPSAINPETGFFNVQPKVSINYSQENLAELRKSLIRSTHQDNTPQLVKDESAEDIIQSAAENKASLLTNYRKEVGNLSFVKEIFNSKIASKCSFAVTMALNSFKTIGRGDRILAFNSLDNVSGARILSKNMGSELKEAKPTNSYIENIVQQQLEEEKKKQQGCI